MDSNENNTNVSENMNTPSQEDRWAQYRSAYSSPQAAAAPGTAAVPPKKSHKGLIIFLIILGVALALLLIGGMALKNTVQSYNPWEPAAVEYDYDTNQDYIGLIDIQDEIGGTGTYLQPSYYDQDWILEQIDDMENTPANKGLILYLDTPGGSVYETDEVYLKLLEYKEATGNPVYAVMGSMCASGGYYLSCAADKIYANRNTTTGSIGVTFGTMLDISGLLADYNVKTNTITSGPNKAMGSMYEPMTDEQRAIFQSLIDEAYDQFTGIVAEGRHMDIAKVKELADGRIYTAKQAREAGLIDEVCSYNDAISDICEEAGLPVEQVYEYQYQPETSLFGMFFEALTQERGVNSADQDLAALIKLAQQGELKPMYLMGN